MKPTSTKNTHASCIHTLSTQSGQGQQFNFLGLHGQGLGIRLEKAGYEDGNKIPYQRPGNYFPDTNNPLVITMWKLKGAEPMIHDKKFYGITPNGQAFTIDLVSKKKIASENAAGDLQVRINRPQQIKPHEKFDWSFTMTAIGGGFVEVTNSTYLNEAPENGYEPSYQIEMSTTNSNWQEQIEKTFYIKIRNGKVYGHFHVVIIPNYNDTSVFDMESYINPSGSRNLEFDSKKLNSTRQP